MGARIIAKPNLSREVTAVSLAAGHGTRMRSRTPKVLHPICGRPMVDWVVDAVMAAGSTDVKAIVSSHHAEVAAHLDSRTEVIYQREAEGTGHAVMQVPAEVLSRGDVLVVNADSPLLTAESIRKVIDTHRSSRAEATIASVYHPRPDDGRIVRTADGGFERIVEKQDASADDRAGSEINVGLYCFQGTPLVEALGKITKSNPPGG